MRLRTLARKQIDDVLLPYRRHGHLQLGEDISQLQHGLQCAWYADRDGAPDHMVIAALLHDVGHLLTWEETGRHPEAELKNGYHEKVGSQFLALYFDDAVVKPVRLHVAAKRYRYSIDKDYRRSLSQASIDSLMLQGGPMDESTCRAFESSPWFNDALLLRKYDELGKDMTFQAPGLEHHMERLIQHTRVVKARLDKETIHHA